MEPFGQLPSVLPCVRSCWRSFNRLSPSVTLWPRRHIQTPRVVHTWVLSCSVAFSPRCTVCWREICGRDSCDGTVSNWLIQRDSCSNCILLCIYWNASSSSFTARTIVYIVCRLQCSVYCCILSWSTFFFVYILRLLMLYICCTCVVCFNIVMCWWKCVYIDQNQVSSSPAAMVLLALISRAPSRRCLYACGRASWLSV